MTPRLSIITVVLNGEDFIASCLQNVMSQECPEVEHLIIDGGSTDKTVQIVQNFADRYSYIRLFIEKGLSQSAAMNKGIALARGAYIGFLNDDDYYEPGVLCRILKLFSNLPEPSFLVGNCNIRDEKENITGVNKPHRLKLYELLLGNQINPHPINPSAYFYHKSLHHVAGFYCLEEEYGMDLEFILKAVIWANVKYYNEIWGNFRFIQGTKTYTDSSSPKAEERERHILEPFFNSLSIREKYYLRFFQYLLTRFPRFRKIYTQPI